MATGAAVQLVGNIISDVALQHTDAGTPFLTFKVAYHPGSYFNESARRYHVGMESFDCEIWGSQAERVARCFKKGHRVVIIGELHSGRIWITEIGASLAYSDVTVAE